MERKVVIYGNGNMAKVLHSYIRHSNHVVGFTVEGRCIAEKTDLFCGLPLVPLETVDRVFSPNLHQMIVAVGFLDMNDLRARIHSEIKKRGYGLTSFIHETVIKHDEVYIGEDCIILDHVSIHPGSKIGNGSFISSNVNIGHSCTIGGFNWINSGVAIGGGCRIGAGCFFGINSSVSNDIQVGANTFLAANTLLNKNSKDNQVFISQPGQLFRLKSKPFLKFSRIFGTTEDRLH